MISLLDYTYEEMEKLFQELGEPKFRGSQVFDWIYKGAKDFDEMTNIPGALREKLKSNYTVGLLKVLDMQVSKTDGTRKFLFGLRDGNAIETVFMKYKYGNSICVSSQAGCRMGCKFCASTVKGLSRNLTAGEMIGQILTAEAEAGEKINHIVVMGTGEPFDNYENLAKFLKIVHSEKGLSISNRNITVSTCGIVPMIEEFAKDFPQVNLAISLHGAIDEKRSSMMPINNKYPLAELINASKEYTLKTNRRITFEYTMVNGINDSDEDAKLLAGLLKGILCHVNIIPLNKVEGNGFDTVSRNRAEEFAKLLEKSHIPVTVRRELGGDIDAACGQLRLKNTIEGLSTL